MSKIMVTGAAGMLGRTLSGILADRFEVIPLSSGDLDVRSLYSVREMVQRARPQWVVHCAAYTAVDKAETETLEAFRTNAMGTRNMAVAARECGSCLLYFSTDYVFDGTSQRPYREWDPVHPLNEYGRSKLAGEQLIRALCSNHLIVRTSWLYGAGGANFVDKILSKAGAGEELQIVDDQRGSPTFTTDLSYLTLNLIERDLRGTYHVTNSEDATWFEFAREVVAQAGLEVEIVPVKSGQIGAAAQRPAFSVLDNFALKLEGIPLLRSWKRALSDHLRTCDV